MEHSVVLFIIIGILLCCSTSGEISFLRPNEYFTAIVNYTYIDSSTGQPKSECLESCQIFGAMKENQFSGVLVHVTSNNHTTHTACDPLDTDRIPNEPFIALVKRGQCNEFIKLNHIAAVNASAAVLYTELLDMSHLRLGYKTHYPPYIFTTSAKGEELAALVDNGTRVVLYIEIQSFVYEVGNPTSILFVSISFLSLALISMTWLVFYYIQRFRHDISKGMISKRLCSATEKALARIPVKTLKAKDYDSDDDECCAVCIETLRPNEVVRVLPCNHSFHKVCVDPWLLQNRSCPICKLDILSYFGLFHTGSMESVLELEDVQVNRRRSVISDIIHVSISRRNSYSQTAALTEDRGTSPCSFTHLNIDRNTLEIDHAHGILDSDGYVEDTTDTEDVVPVYVFEVQPINGGKFQSDDLSTD